MKIYKSNLMCLMLCLYIVMKTLTLALKEIDPVGLHRQLRIHAQEI
jgi:hypothetical protein